LASGSRREREEGAKAGNGKKSERAAGHVREGRGPAGDVKGPLEWKRARREGFGEREATKEQIPAFAS